MHHTANSRPTRLGDHRGGVVNGVARVNNKWHTELASEGDLFGESAALLKARRMIIVIVETTFTDRNGAECNVLAYGADITLRRKRRGVMRVHTSRVPDESGPLRRNRSGP